MAAITTRVSRSLSSLSSRFLLLSRLSSSSPPTSRFTNTTASFDWSDSDSEQADSSQSPKSIDQSKLPPPYDPFSKSSSSSSAIDEPTDPSNLQEIFHKLRTEGLTNHAVKMFDGLSKLGLTHEALELFAVIREKGTMPDVVAHTAVIEAYVNAGGLHWKDAVRTYEKMLASGVLPNAYTFSVFITGLAKQRRVAEARKYLVEMVTRGMRPSVGTYLSVFEAYLSEEKILEGKELLEELKGKGFVPDEREVREGFLKRGHVFRGIMNLLFDK